MQQGIKIADLRNFVEKLVPLGDEEFDAFARCLRLRVLKKKENLINEGEICSKIGFFTEGYFRFYHMDINGNEITSDFHFSPGFITSYTSFLTGSPSRTNVQALEPMEVMEIGKTSLYSLYSEYPLIERLGRLMAEHVFITSERHLMMILNQTAETRYRLLLDKYPHYVGKIPLQYIASYLGITQETLSRMRKSIGG